MEISKDLKNPETTKVVKGMCDYIPDEIQKMSVGELLQSNDENIQMIVRVALMAEQRRQLMLKFQAPKQKCIKCGKEVKWTIDSDLHECLSKRIDGYACSSCSYDIILMGCCNNTFPFLKERIEDKNSGKEMLIVYCKTCNRKFLTIIKGHEEEISW